MAGAHIVHAFDKDLAKTEGLLLEMGGLVEAQINDATNALIHRNKDLGAKVRKGDKRINALDYKINTEAVGLLALRQPMAEDLRVIIAIMKAAADLERIGDYAKNIAKRLDILVQSQPMGSAASTLKRMSMLIQEMVSDGLDAFVRRDMAMAEDIRQRDREVDLMHNTLFRELLTYMMEDPRNITPCMHLLFIAKNIERAGDHAVGIADQVIYLICGSMPEEKRPKSDKTATIGVDPEAR